MLEAGTRIGHYRVEAPLGRGGMGEVYAAFDERLERRVALKLLTVDRAFDTAARGRMLREARAASALNHPGIVTIYEIGEDGGRTYLAMELIDGRTLAEVVADRRALPVAEAVALFIQITDAVAAAHAAGVLHRDLKTANLMVDARGRAKVLDFGLSKRLAPSDAATPSAPAVTPATPASAPPSAPTLPATTLDQDVDPVAPTEAPLASGPLLTPALAPPALSASQEPVTIHGARMGTPGSSAPELMHGEEADQRSDVFSLGVVLYELCTGERPFRQRTLAELIDAMAHERYAAPSRANPLVPPALEAVVARALRPAREARFESVDALAAATRAAVAPPGRARKLGAAAVFAGMAALAATGALAIALRGGDGDAPAGNASGVPGTAPRDAAAGRPKARPAPVALTKLGGCAYAPAFIGEGTVVFDLTRDGADDLWAVPAAGGDARRLTEAATWEWRPAPGRRPGEIVFLVSDPSADDARNDGIGAVELTGERMTLLARVQSTGVWAHGEDVFYIRRDGRELRRIRAGEDEAVATFPPEVFGRVLEISRDGTKAAVVTGGNGPVGVCVVDLDRRTAACPATRRPSSGRATWSTDDASLYYASWTGVRRLFPDGRDEPILPDVVALGGLAVSPDGRRLAYSDCVARGPILDVGGPAPEELARADRYGELAAGPNGHLAYSRTTAEGPALFLREPGGTVRELARAEDGRFLHLAFSRDGALLAWVHAGRGGGIFTARVDRNQTLTPTRLTSVDGDLNPTWLADGRLAFTRKTATGPRVLLLDPTGGGEPRPFGDDVEREVWGVLADGSLFALSPDGELAFEVDPRTGRSRRARVQPGALGRPRYLAVSSDGRWLMLQLGDQGQRVYRADLAAPEPRLELVYEAPSGQTLSRGGITPEGRPIVAPLAWVGEVYSLEAAAGERF